MPSRFIHHDDREFYITTYDADGGVVHRQRATGVVGSPTLYQMMVEGLTQRLADGEWLDTSEAEAENRRLDELRDEISRQLWADLESTKELREP